MRHHTTAALGAAIGLAITLAACSSSGQTSGATASGGTSTPIKLMVWGQLQASAFAFPDMADGAKAAAQAINAAGGVDGRKIVVTACNDGGDPNQAAACARQAVTGGYTALVGGVSLYDNDVFPILDKAGIPVIASSPLNSAADTSPMSFPIDSNPAQFAASGIALVKYAHCKQVAVLYDDYATAAVSAQNVEQGIKWAGGTVTKSIPVPPTQPDYSSVISTALGSGAQCIGTALAPADVVKAVTALRASSKPNAPFASTVGSVPLAIVKPLGKAAEGIIITNNAFTPDSAVWKPVRDAMTKFDPSVQIENFGVLAWSAVYAFADIAKGINGAITAKSVAEAAAAQTALKPIGYPNAVSWMKPGPVKGAPRLVNTAALQYVIKGGTYSLVSSTPVDASAALASAG